MMIRGSFLMFHLFANYCEEITASAVSAEPAEPEQTS